MDVSNLFNRLLYNIRWYLSAWSPGTSPFLRQQALESLEDVGPEDQASQDWNLRGISPWVFMSLPIVVGLIPLLINPQQGWQVSDQVGDQIGQFGEILWQVQAGLLSIGFVVIVLLMQVLGDRDQLGEYLFKEYVRRSGIVKVALLGLSTIGVMGLATLLGSLEVLNRPALTYSTIVNSFLLLLNIVAVGYIYLKIIDFIIPGHSVRLTAEMIQNNIRKRFRNTVLEALARSLLHAQATGGDFEYKVTSPHQRSREVEYPVAGESKLIYDIDLDAFKRVVSAIKHDQQASPGLYLRASIGAKLSSSSSVIGFLREDAPDYAERRIPKYFIVRQDSEEGAEIEDSIENLGDRADQAVREQQPARLSELLDVYVEALRSYTRYVQQFKSETLSSIRNDPFTLIGYQNPGVALHGNITDLTERAIKQDEKSLIKDLLSLPVEVMRISQSYDNRELFYRFAATYVRIYSEAEKLPPASDARALAIDRCWRHLKEYSQYRLQYLYASQTEDIIEQAPFAGSLLRVFLHLLKAALSRKDADSFDTFSSAFDSLLEDLPRTHRKARSERSRIERQQNDGDDSTQNLDQLREAENELKKLINLKDLINFGIASWALDLHYRNELSRDQLRSYFQDRASHFTNLDELYRTYMLSLEPSVQDRFPWSNWDDERHDRDKGQIVTGGYVTTESWLRRFYVVRGLQIVAPTQSVAVELPSSKKLKSEAPQILEISNEIKESGHPLDDYDDLEDRVETFKEAHREAWKRQEEKENEELIETPLDGKRVEAFREGFREQWIQNNLDCLLSPFTPVEEEESTNVDIEKLAAPALREDFFEDKRLFTGRSPEEAAFRIGKDRGRTLGGAERRNLVYALRSSLPVIYVSEGKLLERLESELETKNVDADLILVSQGTSQDLRSSDGFVPEWKIEEPQDDLPGYIGEFNDMPVCVVPDDSGVLIALNAAEGLEPRRIAKGQAEIAQIEPIDQETAATLLEESPSLGEDFDSKESAIRNLRQRVLVKRGTGQVGFDVDSGAGIVIRIE